MTDLNYLIAVSVLPISALIIAGIVLLIARRDDRLARRQPPAE